MIFLYCLALTTAVIGNAYYQKKQFYPSVVYITKSNPSMAVIYIQAFILVLLMGKLMRKVFFGQLRAAEFEHLMERSWYAITETCLAFTVFRDDFNPKFVALFTVLLFLKSFHWLADDRVDYMERSPVIGWLFHVRVLSLLAVLGMLDFHFIGHAYQSTITKGASVQLVFGFEYAILITMVVNIAIKYALHSVDLNSDNPWDNKAVFLLYTELVMGFIKVILYVSFVAIMVRIYTLPLFAFRPMYYTMRNFKKAFNDVILSRRAIRNMNTLYPDATAEELLAADNVCIICREEMTTASKKLPCNHIFHTSCLRSWFQRQQTCPTCRLNILRPTPTQSSQAARPVPQQVPQPAGGEIPQHPVQVGPNPFQPGMNPFQAAAGPGFNPFQVLGGGANMAGVPGGANPPLLVPPLPPFPFMPFMAPPPMPPQNLQSLSVEELRQMEGNERNSIEARIQCLRNIQVMLDASVLMMQQYSAAAALSAPPPATTSTASQQTEEQPQPSTSKSPELADEFTPSPTTSTPTPTTPVPSTSTSAATEPSGETDELRRRRLQHFEQQQQQ
ncbi:septin interacting protein 3 [Carabus blaptoides fortunei]